MRRLKKNNLRLRAQPIEHESGFTLVEILMVVAILGIFCAIAIPNYLLIQAKSKRLEGMVYLNHVGIAEIAYYLEYDTYTLSNNKIDAYMMITASNKPKYYFFRQLHSDDQKFGYTCLIQGNLDTETVWYDLLLLKKGDPGNVIGGNLPDGISLLQDDIVN